MVKPVTWFRYKNEKKLYRGKLKSKGNNDSILLFTTHKCASTYTCKILAQLTEPNDYINVNLEAYFSVKSIDPRIYFSDESYRNKTFVNTGFCFAPLRYFYPIKNLDTYKKILVLRDPRDVLSSFYYSKKFSHIVISKSFYDDRQKYLDYEIDEFVLEYAPEIKRVYQKYVDNLLGTKNTIILPYEMMVGDFDQWLNKLTDFLNLNTVSAELVDSLKRNEKNISGSGKQTSHIRSKTPGDYLKKLKPETIQILNEEFKGILTKLNYNV